MWKQTVAKEVQQASSTAQAETQAQLKTRERAWAETTARRDAEFQAELASMQKQIDAQREEYEQQSSATQAVQTRQFSQLEAAHAELESALARASFDKATLEDALSNTQADLSSSQADLTAERESVAAERASTGAFPYNP